MPRRKCMPPPPPRKELCDNPVKKCSEISRIFHSRLREERSIEGVLSQPGARLVLAVLAINDGINQKRLVEETHLRAPTVSGILRKMEEEGMVERKNGEDKREFMVYITEYGKNIDRQGIETIKKYERIALRDIGEDDTKLLMTLLSRIRDNLLECEETFEKREESEER